MKFKGRDWLFVAVVAMLVVPLQMALIPLLRLITGGAHIGTFTIFPYLHLNNSVAAIWVAHICFGLPFCIFILKNFMSSLPSDVIEAARVDGAGHLTVFARLVLPLSVPALASLAIFQFMYIWNDLLIGLVYGGSEEQADHRQAGRGRRHVRPVVAPAHRLGVHLDGRPVARVLRTAALLRARPARRSGQGVATRMSALQFPSRVRVGRGDVEPSDRRARRGGRREDVWDRFSRAPGAIADGTVAGDACDHLRLMDRRRRADGRARPARLSLLDLVGPSRRRRWLAGDERRARARTAGWSTCSAKPGSAVRHAVPLGPSSGAGGARWLAGA